MVAGIETHDDGRATFVAVEKHGWHRLGTLSKKALSVTEALQLAHLHDLSYHLEPIAVPVGSPPVFVFGGDYRAVVRRNPFDRDEWQVIGAGMRDGYMLHTPEQAFGFGENLIDAGKPLAALGSIAGGRRAFAAFHADDIRIGGVDQIRMYLNVMTAFDTSMSTTVRTSAIRVECENTFQAVMHQTTMPTYRVRHVGTGLEGRVEDAREALEISYKGIEQFQKEAEALIDREVTEARFEEIVAMLLPSDKQMSPSAQSRAMDGRDEVRKVYAGSTVKEIAGTAWGVLNAYTEWADWTGGQFKSPEARMVAQITPGSPIDDRRQRAARIVARAVGIG